MLQQYLIRLFILWRDNSIYFSTTGKDKIIYPSLILSNISTIFTSSELAATYRRFLLEGSDNISSVLMLISQWNIKIIDYDNVVRLLCHHMSHCGFEIKYHLFGQLKGFCNDDIFSKANISNIWTFQDLNIWGHRTTGGNLYVQCSLWSSCGANSIFFRKKYNLVGLMAHQVY